MTAFELIIQYFEKDSFFNAYKYRKRDSSFVQKFNDGYRKIDLRHHRDFYYLWLHPGFTIRFDFVHRWFEKYSFKPLQVQRDIYTVGATPKKYDLGGKYGGTYLFDLNSNSLLEDCDKVKQIIKTCADFFFSEYKTPEDVYIHDVLPIIEGKKELPRVGADWLFENLTICKVVAPENYEKLKAMSLERAKWLMTPNGKSRPDLNMAHYYDRLDEILCYLESLSVEDLMKKRIKK